jgi:hypothetical protein
MKNYIIVSVLLVLFSSCGLLQPRGGNLRLVKAGEKEVVLIERKYDRAKSQTEMQLTKEFVTVQAVNTLEYNLADPDSKKTQKSQLEYSNLVDESEKIEPEEEEPSEQEKADMAFQSERQANTSLYLFIGGLISVFMPYVGIFLFGIGLYFFAKARNARFITPAGEERLRVAKVFLIIDAVILLLYVSLILLIILLI